MQSFIQYKRIGKSIEEQLQNHKTNVAGFQGRLGQRPTDPTFQSGNQEDLEKGLPSDEERCAGQKDEERRTEWHEQVVAQQGSKSVRPDTRDAQESNESGGEGLKEEDKEENEKEEEIEETESIDHDNPARSSLSQSEAIKTAREANPTRPNILSRLSSTTRRSRGTALGLTLTGVNVRDRTSKEGGDSSRQVFVVGYQGDDDPMNPHNWSKFRRGYATMLVASIGAVVGLASAIDASALTEAAAEFGVSEVAESLATGLFFPIFGLCTAREEEEDR